MDDALQQASVAERAEDHHRIWTPDRMVEDPLGYGAASRALLIKLTPPAFPDECWLSLLFPDAEGEDRPR